jgi:hypothetical protein
MEGGGADEAETGESDGSLPVARWIITAEPMEKL